MPVACVLFVYIIHACCCTGQSSRAPLVATALINFSIGDQIALPSTPSYSSIALTVNGSLPVHATAS